MFGELDAHRETLDADDEAGYFLHDYIVESPFSGCENLEDVGTEEDAEE